MHTLEQLRRGELAGIQRLDLAADLGEFPDEIFGLADSLEVLNLSGNRLRALPHDLSRLHRLKVLFCSDNPFETLPESLGDCPQLEMVGFKSNQLCGVPAAALPARLRWLILTDNRIENLPSELGERPRLQKLMLAGNRLSALPQSMAGLHQLELLRIAANRLETLPDWLLELPRLAWLAYAGNPGSDRAEAAALASHPQAPIPRSQLEVGELLGQGASGLIHRARWSEREVAVKLFKGQMTSDGLPHSEMAACLSAGRHPQLLPVIGPLQQQPGQPDGLLLELLDPRFSVLAGPPSLASCTRDCYGPEQRFDSEQVLALANGVAGALAHLHERGILHGDLYAHNLLVAGRDCRLSDFGAASFFAPNSAQGAALQRLESRAFGILLEELLQRCEAPAAHLLSLAADCQQADTLQRPPSAEIVERLRG
ncbi:leucine-rich repeat-containing protein kinase family protein [Pseudomonas sp. Gutcm_11s]|uniref:leucine-rich repeat-containing protein kinase family protein n=1 Tax=Pseudomonas sp. Gutcm_11s TaxID=3026088 RepID=UPI002362A320|nr:leucine-rich repeat-containing protein kinase family protein [Pseudomonas sp. Gutcm_11s]MDD0843987.1 leucine-rich repeat-containing protein kinase family protein [Pseudomonas sp. Gutcm_11s]